ncbi:MAG: FtsB family cell division protein [Shimia sp.]
MIHRPRAPIGVIAYATVCLGLALYFTFAAVQGDYGLFRRAEIDAQKVQLLAQKEALDAEIAALENKTRRLSDDFLDLDLLDERARDLLGYVRPDEVVIR